MHVAEGLLLFLIGGIAESFTSTLLDSNRLSVGPVTPPVLEEGHGQVSEGQKNGGAETAHHSDDSSRVLRCLVFPECLGTDEIASGIADVDDGEGDGLLGSSGGIGLRQRDEDNVRGWSNQ